MIEIYRLGVPSMAGTPRLSFLTAGHRQLQVTACLTCGKGTQCSGNCCSTRKRTCSSDLFHEHIGSHLWLVSEMTQVLFGCPMLSESGLYWDEEGLCFQLSDKPELFIGYVFMLHLVTFAASKLFVSSGDVALGTVLKGPSAGPALRLTVSHRCFPVQQTLRFGQSILWTRC